MTRIACVHAALHAGALTAFTAPTALAGCGPDALGDGMTDGAAAGGDSEPGARPDPVGALSWEVLIDGGVAGPDGAQALAWLPDGALLVGGGSTRSASGQQDAVVYALDPEDGSVRWSWAYGGPGDGNDVVQGLMVDTAGQIVGVGNVTSSGDADGRDGLIFALDERGETIWLSSYTSGLGLDTFSDVAELSDGRLCAAGRRTRDAATETTEGIVQCFVDGGAADATWVAPLDGPTSLIDLAPTPQGGLAVVGRRDEAAGRAGHWLFLSAALEAQGAWSYELGTGVATLNGIDAFGDGAYAVGGYVGRGDQPDAAYVGTLAADGRVIQGYAFDGREPETGDLAFDVAVDPWGDTIVAGKQTEAAGERAFVAKRTPGQAPAWIRYRDDANALEALVDGAGNVYVVGSVRGDDGDRDLWIARYTP